MNPLNWGGFAVVMAILIPALAYAVTDWFRCADEELQRVIDQVLDVDHEPCANPDCDQVLCYCRRATACFGTVDPGCDHVGAFLCSDHTITEHGACCDECRTEAHHEAFSWLEPRSVEQRAADQDRFDTVGLPRGTA